jgi:IS1 family transposase
MPVRSNKFLMSAPGDEVETFIGSKKTCIWLWKAVEHFRFWHLGDRLRRS